MNSCPIHLTQQIACVQYFHLQGVTLYDHTPPSIIRFYDMMKYSDITLVGLLLWYYSNSNLLYKN
jgi:hypothetical protein